MIWKLHPTRWPFYIFLYFLKEVVILNSVFGHHFVRKQLLVPCFWFSRTRWFSSSLFVRIPFFATFYVVLYFCIFASLASLPTRTPLMMSRVCFLMFNNSILSLQKALKKTNSMVLSNDLAPQNSYKMITWKSTTLPFGCPVRKCPG